MKSEPSIHKPSGGRNWLAWLFFTWLRLMTLLPWSLQKHIASFLGTTLMIFARRRVQIAKINIDLCFPELSPHTRKKILRRHFGSFVMGLFEMADGWWASDAKFRNMTEIKGIEHLEKAYAEGKGVILLSAHFTTLEIGGRILADQKPELPLKALYRPSEIPVFEYLIRKNRSVRFGEPIRRDDIRSLLKALKKGDIIWYASDQNYGHKGSVFAPFFGVLAATNTAITRLASTGAKVVPFFTQRLPDGRYRQLIEPALDHFPGNTPLSDATRINQLISGWIKQAPDQYFWTHRRFKDRPDHEPRFY